ncbi:MAG TPA: hypothetical protein VH308_08080 [Terracidiphilus sp.]|jgi:uncharacterized membrane protein|nr:hypothetical protein [Terracidiphilus sp.]
MAPEAEIDRYLDSVKARLRTVTSGEREEITGQISARIRDSLGELGASVETVLARLGPPEKLAVKYRDARLITKASDSYLPQVLLHALIRSGIQGVLVFVVGLIGYWLGGGLVAYGAVLMILTEVLPSAANRSAAGAALAMIGVGVLILFLITIALHYIIGFFRRRQPAL